MKPKSYFYNCSPEYIHSIDPGLQDQIILIIEALPKRQTQSEINADLFWLLTSAGWNYDTVPVAAGNGSPDEFDIELSIDEIKKNRGPGKLGGGKKGDKVIKLEDYFRI